MITKKDKVMRGEKACTESEDICDAFLQDFYDFECVSGGSIFCIYYENEKLMNQFNENYFVLILQGQLPTLILANNDIFRPIEPFPSADWLMLILNCKFEIWKHLTFHSK